MTDISACNYTNLNANVKGPKYREFFLFFYNLISEFFFSLRYKEQSAVFCLSSQVFH